MYIYLFMYPFSKNFASRVLTDIYILELWGTSQYAYFGYISK